MLKELFLIAAFLRSSVLQIYRKNILEKKLFQVGYALGIKINPKKRFKKRYLARYYPVLLYQHLIRYHILYCLLLKNAAKSLISRMILELYHLLFLSFTLRMMRTLQLRILLSLLK